MSEQLDHYLSNLEYLPDAIQNNLLKLRKLDEKIVDIMVHTDRLVDEYLTKEFPSEEKKAERLAYINSLFAKAKRCVDNKVKLSQDAYEMVDQGIKRFDSYLTKFQDEIKQNPATIANKDSLNVEKKENISKKKKKNKMPKSNRNTNVKKSTSSNVNTKSTNDDNPKRNDGNIRNKKSISSRNNKSSNTGSKSYNSNSKSSSNSANTKRSNSSSNRNKSSNNSGKNSNDKSSNSKHNNKSSESGDKDKYKRKKGTSTQSSDEEAQMKLLKKMRMHSISETSSKEAKHKSSKQSGDRFDMPVDPNEPVYCTCKQVSYGEMVACDNRECSIEWFHFECVGLKNSPKGKWYCKECIDRRKKSARFIKE